MCTVVYMSGNSFSAQTEAVSADITGGTFTNNAAILDGGGLHVDGTKLVTLSSLVFVNSTVSEGEWPSAAQLPSTLTVCLVSDALLECCAALYICSLEWPQALVGPSCSTPMPMRRSRIAPSPAAPPQWQRAQVSAPLPKPCPIPVQCWHATAACKLIVLRGLLSYS
jgi:hypothetical protein